ncbi:MAG: hypothetical protein CM1200mP30_34500 [Pseudomonadota bacterium]|nr:MAG: hypothetical protein CM1200mP30_34500 [Pseudomonadota bacterium]
MLPNWRKEIKLINKTQRFSGTSGLTIKKKKPDWHTQLSHLSLIQRSLYLNADWNLGLIFEFATPGTLIPGIVGTVSLMLSLYAFSGTSYSYAGFALMLFGLALMIRSIRPQFLEYLDWEEDWLS